MTEQSNEAVVFADSESVQESAYVNSVFSNQQPDARAGNSMLIHDIAKNFYSKQSVFKRSLIDREVKHVFPGVSFSIKDCEVFGLLGPNGAGKTTLINILVGNLNPTTGEIKIMGYPRSSSVVRNHIGVVPQFDTLFEELTVCDHLKLIALLHNISLKAARHQSKLIAERVGLERDPFLHKASLLSGGQKRRLTLGMAMMSQPRVLLLDEPTVLLDFVFENRPDWILKVGTRSGRQSSRSSRV